MIDQDTSARLPPWLGEKVDYMRDEIGRLRAENAAMLAQWPEFIEGMESCGNGVVWFQDGEWWCEYGDGCRHGYASKEEAVREFLGDCRVRRTK